MKITLGAMGWTALMALTMGLGGCDDAKATCEKMCDKMGECLPAQVDDALSKVPAGAKGAADQMKAEMEKKLEKTVADCKSQCDSGEEVSETEKERLAKAKECLDEDCKGFIACIDGI